MTGEWLPAKQVEEIMLKNDFVKIRRGDGCLHFKKVGRFSAVHVIFAKDGGKVQLKNAHYEAHFHRSIPSQKLLEQIEQIVRI